MLDDKTIAELKRLASEKTIRGREARAALREYGIDTPRAAPLNSTERVATLAPRAPTPRRQRESEAVAAPRVRVSFKRLRGTVWLALKVAIFCFAVVSFALWGMLLSRYG